MSQAIAPESFREWNEQMIRRYDPEIFHHHPRGLVRWVENKRVRLVLKSLDARKGERVLDVGCGAGNMLAQLPGCQRYGIDLSAFMLSRARARLGSEGVLLHGDGEQLPFPDGLFDRLIASSLLSHVLHPERIADEIIRVMRPGGRVVFSVCHEDQIEKGLNWLRRLGLAREPQRPDQPNVYNVEYHVHRFSPKRLLELVGTRLKLVSLSRAPLVYPVHWIAAYERER